jgi:hypothetical protein
MADFTRELFAQVRAIDSVEVVHQAGCRTCIINKEGENDHRWNENGHQAYDYSFHIVTCSVLTIYYLITHARLHLAYVTTNINRTFSKEPTIAYCGQIYRYICLYL